MKQETESTAHSEAPTPSDYLDDLKVEEGFEAISDEQALEYLETVLNIMKVFVDVGWDVARIPRYLTDFMPDNGNTDAPLVQLPDSSPRSQFIKSANTVAEEIEES